MQHRAFNDFEAIQFLLEKDDKHPEYSDRFNSLLNRELSDITVSTIREFFPEYKLTLPLSEKSLRDLLGLFDDYFQKIKEPKCIIPVMGPRWSGKSTFLYYLAGIPLAEHPKRRNIYNPNLENNLAVNIGEPSIKRTIQVPTLVSFNNLTFLECPDIDYFGEYDERYLKSFLSFILRRTFSFAQNLISPIVVIDNTRAFTRPCHDLELNVRDEIFQQLKFIFDITKKMQPPSITFCFSRPFNRTSEELTSDDFRFNCLGLVDECIRQSEYKLIRNKVHPNSKNEIESEKLSRQIEFVKLFKQPRSKIFCFLPVPIQGASVESREQIIKHIRQKINENLYFVLKGALIKTLVVDDLLLNTAIFLTPKDAINLVQTCKGENENSKKSSLK